MFNYLKSTNIKSYDNELKLVFGLLASYKNAHLTETFLSQYARENMTEACPVRLESKKRKTSVSGHDWRSLNWAQQEPSIQLLLNFIYYLKS